jgi:hypothetical protein
MWVRKTPTEIIMERHEPRHRLFSAWRRLSNLMPAGLLGFCLGIAVSGEGGGRYGPGKPITSTGVLVGATFGLLAMIAARLRQRRFRKPLFFRPWQGRSQICGTCHQLRPYDRHPDCDCGGKFEDSDDWKWVED